jgi:hypothetical protein
MQIGRAKQLLLELGEKMRPDERELLSAIERTLSYRKPTHLPASKPDLDVVVTSE